MNNVLVSLRDEGQVRHSHDYSRWHMMTRLLEQHLGENHKRIAPADESII